MHTTEWFPRRSDRPETRHGPSPRRRTRCPTSPCSIATQTPSNTASAERSRLFITDAILTGLPPHIAQVIVGHRDINVTLGYKAVYPDEVIQAHRAFLARRRALRPTEEYRNPTDAEWEEFLGHFERRKVSAGLCGRAFATPCIHEHACLTEMILVVIGLRQSVQGVRSVTEKYLVLLRSRACRLRTTVVVVRLGLTGRLRCGCRACRGGRLRCELHA